MAKLTEVKEYKKNGDTSVKAYRITLRKTGIEKTGLTADDELEVTYKKDKIVITKKI